MQDFSSGAPKIATDSRWRFVSAILLCWSKTSLNNITSSGAGRTYGVCPHPYFPPYVFLRKTSAPPSVLIFSSLLLPSPSIIYWTQLFSSKRDSSELKSNTSDNKVRSPFFQTNKQNKTSTSILFHNAWLYNIK